MATRSEVNPPLTLKDIWLDINCHIRRMRFNTIYDWLPYAGIEKPKKTYTMREFKKLVFIAHSLNQIRSLDYASQRLREDLKLNADWYNDDRISPIDYRAVA